MFRLEKKFRFEAAHTLKYHKGRCGRLHGHSYQLTVSLQSNSLIAEGSSTNMVMDFSDIGKIVEPMIKQYLDHHDLNKTLENDSPSSEFIARWIYRYLKPKLPPLFSVTICETESSSVTFWE